MSPRVTYWTGTWDPAKEAISKEIVALRVGGRAHAPVVSFSPGQSAGYDWRHRTLMLSPRTWPVLRAVAAVIEPMGDVTHVFGGQISWHLFRALGRRPLVLTAVAARTGDERLPHLNIARVVVETEQSIAEWTDAGVPRDRIEVLHPGIDVTRFAVAPAPAGRFTLLFASTPSDVSDFDLRGLPLLVELARRRPDVDVLVPWRQWGDVARARRAIEALAPPGNFVVEHGDVTDMRETYARAHATIVAFAPGVGKTAPNFVIEGLACGRPTIATEGSGLSSMVSRADAGLVVPRDADALSHAVDVMRANWGSWSVRARALAEAHFDLRAFLARYEEIYGEVSRQGT